MKQKKITIYTDGSSLGNPGDGGWGVIFLVGKKEFEIGGRKENVTNNQMELLAFLKALESLVKKNIKNYQITIFSDSKYVLIGITEWINNWKKNNWKTANKKPVKNQELWQKIDDLKIFLETENELFFKYVKAHSGEKYNERVDDIRRWLAEGKEVDLKNN